VRVGRAPRHYQVHGNGRDAVAFVVSKQPAASTIDVVRGVDRELAGIKSLLPPGAQVRKFYDQADIVGDHNLRPDFGRGESGRGLAHLPAIRDNPDWRAAVVNGCHLDFGSCAEDI
jgi:hypothetical protein